MRTWYVIGAAAAGYFLAPTPNTVSPAAPETVRAEYWPTDPSAYRDSLVVREARRIGVPVDWAWAISHAENWGGDSAAANPASGCVGLMQVCPYRYPSGEPLHIGTLEAECGPETDPPLIGRRRNVCVGLHVLKECIEEHATWSAALACYGGATKDHTRQRYVDAVLQQFRLEWTTDTRDTKESVAAVQSP